VGAGCWVYRTVWARLDDVHVVALVVIVDENTITHLGG